MAANGEEREPLLGKNEHESPPPEYCETADQGVCSSQFISF